MTTLTDRCVQAWADEHSLAPMTMERRRLCARGVRAVLRHLAAELLERELSAQDAAHWIRSELETPPCLTTPS